MSILLIVVAVNGAVLVYADRLGYQETAAEAKLQAALARLRQPGDVYLLPAAYPGPPKAKGSAAATFVPAKPSDRPAIFELQRFRLGTGAAAYIDFKSIPYRADEVLEWRRRMNNAVRWYEVRDWDATGVIDEITAEGVTHVVVPAGVEIRSRRLGLLYYSAAYRVYRVES